MKGKRGLVMGVANDRSIAWGIAQALAEARAPSWPSPIRARPSAARLKPLAESVGSDFLVDVDVTRRRQRSMPPSPALKDALGQARLPGPRHRLFRQVRTDGAVHRHVSRENFKNSLTISCYSLIDVARRARPMMSENGGTMLTLTYQGSNKVTPFYNVMGVAKAALESTSRYLANDLGPEGIRVNAISPGPMKTLAGAAIGGARRPTSTPSENAPLRANATLEAVGGTAVYLARIRAPARPARSSMSMAASTSSACRSRRT